MKAIDQAQWKDLIRRLCEFVFLLVGAALGMAQAPKAGQQLVGGTETNLVMLGRLELNQVAADVVCVYNFSSW